MGFITENFPVVETDLDRLNAISTLTKLLLQEIESMRQNTPAYSPMSAGGSRNFNEDVKQYEMSLICKALVESHGNQTEAARKLGIKNTTLHAKIRKHKIDRMRLLGSSSRNGDSSEMDS